MLVFLFLLPEEMPESSWRTRNNCRLAMLYLLNSAKSTPVFPYTPLLYVYVCTTPHKKTTRYGNPLRHLKGVTVTASSKTRAWTWKMERRSMTPKRRMIREIWMSCWRSRLVSNGERSHKIIEGKQLSWKGVTRRGLLPHLMMNADSLNGVCWGN